MLQYILDHGEERADRTGTGTLSVFGYQARYDISEEFPAITTKKLYWNGVVTELLWFLRGDTNIKYLQDHNVHIWDAWSDDNGDLGPVYGRQWRNWETYENRKFGSDTGFKVRADLTTCDQIANVIKSIKEDPTSRRHIVSAWNVSDLAEMALVPCHAFFQFYVRGDHLDCQLYQRSADAFLGVPFNIASYSLLTYMIAQLTGLKPGHFIHTIGDAHIYKNHIDQVKEQLARDINKYPLPKLELNNSITNIDDFKHEDIKLAGYESYPTIKAPLAV